MFSHQMAQYTAVDTVELIPLLPPLYEVVNFTTPVSF